MWAPPGFYVIGFEIGVGSTPPPTHLFPIPFKRAVKVRDSPDRDVHAQLADQVCAVDTTVFAAQDMQRRAVASGIGDLEIESRLPLPRTAGTSGATRGRRPRVSTDRGEGLMRLHSILCGRLSRCGHLLFKLLAQRRDAFTQLQQVRSGEELDPLGR